MTRDDTVAKLGEVIEAVHGEGALAGVHCCGNTEWPILIDASVDIINFDALDYGETILLYPEPMKAHLKAGKVLAFGIVPTNSAKIQAPTVDSLRGQVLCAGGEAGQSDRAGYAANLPAVVYHAVVRHRLAAGGRCRAGIQDAARIERQAAPGNRRSGIGRLPTA